MTRQASLGVLLLGGLAAGVPGCAGGGPRPAPAGPAVVKHVTVYAEPGRFGGWPANHGLWAWGDEVLVGFSAGYAKDNGLGRHAIDHGRPEEHLLARSTNGGETWAVEDPAAKGALVPAGKALHGVPPPGVAEKPWRDCPGGVDFTHPDFALTARMAPPSATNGRTRPPPCSRRPRTTCLKVCGT